MGSHDFCQRFLWKIAKWNVCAKFHLPTGCGRCKIKGFQKIPKIAVFVENLANTVLAFSGFLLEISHLFLTSVDMHFKKHSNKEDSIKTSLKIRPQTAKIIPKPIVHRISNSWPMGWYPLILKRLIIILCVYVGVLVSVCYLYFWPGPRSSRVKKTRMRHCACEPWTRAGKYKFAYRNIDRTTNSGTLTAGTPIEN